LTEKERLIWAVGLFDGEGCVTVNKSNGRYSLALIINMKHNTDLKRIHELLGGNLYHRTNTKQKSAYWRWEVTGKKAIEIIEKMIPFAGGKKPQLETALKFGETFDGHLSEEHLEIREEIYWKLRELKVIAK
jgi:hypothetical protein